MTMRKVLYQFDAVGKGEQRAMTVEWVDAARFNEIRHIVRVLETRNEEPAAVDVGPVAPGNPDGSNDAGAPSHPAPAEAEAVKAPHSHKGKRR